MAAPDQPTPASPPAGKSPAVSRPSNLDLPGESLFDLKKLIGREKSKGTFSSLNSLQGFGEEAAAAATETALEESALEKLRYEDEMERKRQAYAKMVESEREAKGLQNQTRTPEENERLSALNQSQQTHRKEAFNSKPLPAALSRTSMFDEVANRTDQKTNNEQQAGEQLEQQQQSKRLEQKKNEILESSGINEQKKKAQEEIRKQAKAAIRRGVEEAVQGIGNAIDLGTGGISTVVTIFMYAVTLVDLNLQMASYYFKNKTFDFFFPELTWSPIPMPKIVSVTFLHIGLVVLDLLVLMLLIVGFGIISIIILLPIMGYATAGALILDPALRTQVFAMIAQIF